MAGEFQLDHAGVGEILNGSKVRAMTDEVAEQVADNARKLLGPDIEVGVASWTSDRPKASVAIMHPSGVARQLKRGVLTRAAGMVGLTIGGGGT